jgi:hypothetical protein
MGERRLNVKLHPASLPAASTSVLFSLKDEMAREIDQKVLDWSSKGAADHWGPAECWSYLNAICDELQLRGYHANPYEVLTPLYKSCLSSQRRENIDSDTLPFSAVDFVNSIITLYRQDKASGRKFRSPDQAIDLFDWSDYEPKWRTVAFKVLEEWWVSVGH